MYIQKSLQRKIILSSLLIAITLGSVKLPHHRYSTITQQYINSAQSSDPAEIISTEITSVVLIKGNAKIVVNSSIDFDYTMIVSSKTSNGLENVLDAQSTNGAIIAGLNTISVEFELGFSATPGIIEISIFFVSTNLSQPIVANIKFIGVGYYPLIGIPTFLIIFAAIIYSKEETLLDPKSKEKKKKEQKFDEKKMVSPAQTTTPNYAFPQIECPECKKSIDKGSAYCEHCGFHLPVYQRNG